MLPDGHDGCTADEHGGEVCDGSLEETRHHQGSRNGKELRMSADFYLYTTYLKLTRGCLQ